MPTDLPDAIRDALRAGDIDESDLRRPALRESRRRPTTPRLAIVVVAAAIVVLAGVLAIVVPGDDAPRTADPGPNVTGSSGGPPSGIVAPPTAHVGPVPTGLAGHTWALTTVGDDKGTLTVPDRIKASISYTRNGEVSGDDTVNDMGGRYRLISGGYVVPGGAISTTVGSIGGDPALDRARGAIGAMFFGGTGPITVAASVHGHTATLHRGQFTLTLRESGAQTDDGPASATPTGTH